VRVPVANLVGLEGQGWEIAKFLLANERVAIADTGPKLKLLADIKAMFATRVERDGQSRTMAVIQDRLADAEVQLASLCALEAAYVRDWAEGADRNGPQASILKLRGTEILQLLSEIALEIEGPVGAVHDPAALRGLKTDSEWPSSIAHHYLYGRCWSIFGGTSEIQRTIIARSLLA
jgi:alkylation response protein AidB-like acyl-CoA dehydrogenase